MKVYVTLLAGAPCPQEMEASYRIRLCLDSLFDKRDLFFGQPHVHHIADRLPEDVPGSPEEITGQTQGNQRVEYEFVRQRDKGEAAQHGHCLDDICPEMARV